MPRTLIVKFVDEEKKITIPDGATVTFGPSLPPPRDRQAGGYGGYQPRPMEYALRVYEGASAKTPLIGVFTGVRSFRDAGIEVTYDVAEMEPERVHKRRVEPAVAPGWRIPDDLLEPLSPQNFIPTAPPITAATLQAAIDRLAQQGTAPMQVPAPPPNPAPLRRGHARRRP